MSCVFSSYLRALTAQELEEKFCEKINSVQKLLAAFKRVDRFPREIRINGNKINAKERAQALKTFENIDSVVDGYEMSFGDPGLYIIASVFNMEIKFNYAGLHIHITTQYPSATLYFHATRGHFRFVKRAPVPRNKKMF